MYSLTLGGFLQTGPVGTADDLNLYAYVGNNLVNYTDPTGQWLVNAAMGALNVGIGFSASWATGERDPGTLAWNALIDFGVGAIAGPVGGRAASAWKTRGCVLIAVIGGVFVSGGGMGYIDFVNALSSGKEVHLAAGTIEKLEPRRRNGPRVFIIDGKSTIPNIPITDEEYANLHPGDYYVSNMRLGGLGYYYRWRFDSWNRGWEAKGMGNKKNLVPILKTNLDLDG